MPMHYDKIFRSVVITLPVDVMYMLIRFKLALQNLFHHVTMLCDFSFFAWNMNVYISVFQLPLLSPSFFNRRSFPAIDGSAFHGARWTEVPRKKHSAAHTTSQ